MKTNNYFLTIVGFISGLVAGISIIGFLAFTNAPAASASGGGMVPVTSTEAHGLLSNYLTEAAPINMIVKGFTIDKSQLDAMNALAKENPALAAYRIYLGKSGDSRLVGIVVGVDITGKDAVKNTIFSTDSKNLSPCPPICDVTSPIILDR
ncbi:MAG: hypothetical protein ACOYNC_10760 [Bacteroidales bacterium]